MKKDKIVYLMVICLVIGMLVSFTFHYSAWGKFRNVEKILQTRAEFVNKSWVKYGDASLNERDLASESEIADRVHWTVEYSKKYAENVEGIDYVDVAIIAASIFEKETGWVKYRALDGGLSTGVPSMRYSTAKMVAGELGEEEEFDKKRFRNDVEMQIRFAVWHICELLGDFDGEVFDAVLAYNRGSKGFDRDNPRVEQYYFDVRGRITYLENAL